MKIVVSRISYNVIGGAELSAYDQAVVLKELGHHPVLVTNLKILKERARSEGIQTAWFPWVNRGPGRLRILFFFILLPFTYLWSLLIVYRLKPDIINPHSREDQNAFTLTKFIHKKPVVWKDPGDLFIQLDRNKYGFLYSFYISLQKRAIVNADHIYCLNNEDSTMLLQRVPKLEADKVSNIPSSILYRHYDTNARPYKRKSSIVVIGTLARIEENKGHRYLIEALSKINSKNYEVWIANDGAYKNEIMKMSHKFQNVKFVPFASNVSRYLNTYDIFVHPAEIEGWGRVIKEAMYFGLPIVGSNTGGVAQQITDGEDGFLFKVGDSKALAEILQRLINDKSLRRKIGKAARQKALNEGDFTKVVEENIMPIYQQYLKS